MWVKKDWFNLSRIAVLLFVCLLFGTMGVLAYFTDEKTVLNILSIGENTSSIEEVFNPPNIINPGSIIKKEVRVYNEKSVDCFVRIRAEFSDSDWSNVCMLDINSNDWTLNSDGYYYCNSIIKNNEYTPIFMYGVMVANNMELPTTKLDMIVYSESVQSEGYDSSLIAFASIQ